MLESAGPHSGGMLRVALIGSASLAPDRGDASQLVMEVANVRIRRYGPAGNWMSDCDLAVTGPDMNLEDLIFCVRTAWLWHLKPVICWPFCFSAATGGAHLREIAASELDRLQDALDKAGAVIFADEASLRDFREAGLACRRQEIIGPQGQASFDPEAMGAPQWTALFGSIANRAGKPEAEAAAQSAAPLFIDISTVVATHAIHGIARVEFEYARALHDIYPGTVVLVKYDDKRKDYVMVPDEQFFRHADAFHNYRPFRYGGFAAVEIPPGSTLLTFNILWAQQESYREWLFRFAYGRKIQIIYFIHDYLWGKYPFWFADWMQRSRYDMAEMCMAASALIAYSSSTAKDARQLLAATHVPMPPLRKIRLGDAFVSRRAPLAPVNPQINALPPGAPFILFVSSTPTRKNHELMYAVYHKLLSERDPANVPHLVCVGAKFGWANPGFEAMAADPVVRDHIHIFHDTTDEELDFLYRECLFTVYPSYYEGWGLPVAESLAHGKVCLASNASSIPEIAFSKTDLLDPLDFGAWHDRICAYAFNRQRLREREKEIAGYVGTAWEDAGRNLYVALQALRLRPKDAFIFSQDVALDFAVPGIQPWLPLLGEGWERNPWKGLRLSADVANMRFRVRLGRRLALVLTLRQESDPLQAEINLNGILQRRNLQGSGELLILLETSGSGDTEFMEMELGFANPLARFVSWKANPPKIWITGAVLRPLNVAEVLAWEVLQKLKELDSSLGEVFGEILPERLDLLDLELNAEQNALRLLAWAWDKGLAGDYRLASQRQPLFEIITRMATDAHPDALVPGYTKLLHALRLWRRDLAGFSFREKEGQTALAQWYRDFGALDHDFPVSGARTGFSGQSASARAKINKLLKSTSLKRKSAVSMDYDSLARHAGYVPLEEFLGPEPSLANPGSQLVTWSQLQDGIYYQRCAELGERRALLRKQWEFVYILQALLHQGILKPGANGLGFGCGTEPLPSIFALRGCHVIATDYPEERAEWRGTGQQSLCLEDLWRPAIVEREIFERRVGFERVDMNHIPAKFRGRFDFVWSACALEHLGSIRHGLDFIRNSIACLKPGGVAVHTTELNISDLEETFDVPGLSFFRKKDIESLHDAAEFEMLPVNWSAGNSIEDRIVDFPPFKTLPHLKLCGSEGYIITSIGLVFRKK